MPRHDLVHLLPTTRAVHRALLAEIESLTEQDMRRATLLPGWTVAHVLSHLARNADGQRGMLEGALRGEIVAQYPNGPDGRAADIEAGAGRTAAQVRADVRASTEALEGVWDRLSGEQWDAPTAPVAGDRPAWTSVAARRREVEIHRVDLDLDYRPSQWPVAFVVPLLPVLAEPERLGPRLPAGVTVHLSADDGRGRWAAGSADDTGAEPVALSGPTWALTAWLLGRTEPARWALRGDPPELTPWA